MLSAEQSYVEEEPQEQSWEPSMTATQTTQDCTDALIKRASRKPTFVDDELGHEEVPVKETECTAFNKLLGSYSRAPVGVVGAASDTEKKEQQALLDSIFMSGTMRYLFRYLLLRDKLVGNECTEAGFCSMLHDLWSTAYPDHNLPTTLYWLQGQQGMVRRFSATLDSRNFVIRLVIQEVQSCDNIAGREPAKGGNTISRDSWAQRDNTGRADFLVPGDVHLALVVDGALVAHHGHLGHK